MSYNMICMLESKLLWYLSQGLGAYSQPKLEPFQDFAVPCGYLGPH